MYGDDHRIVTTTPLDRTTSPEPALVPPRIKELQQTLDPNEHHPRNQIHDVQ
jgi:hypothetical protein